MPFAAQAQAAYALNPTPEVSPSQFQVQGGLTFAGVKGQPRTFYNPYPDEFMPRVGFAYNLDSKTVIRGGVGVFYGSLGVRLQDALQTGFNQLTNIVTTNNGGVTFASSLANPFPTGILQPTGSSLGALTYIGNPIGYFNPNPHPARLLKYEIGVERELPGQFVLGAGYLGSRGADLEVPRSLKPLPDQDLSTLPTRDQAKINYLSASLPNPFAGIPQFAGTNLSGTVLSRPSLIDAYPQFSAITYYTYDGSSWYDASNAKFEKRFTHGYLVALTYTWSKYLVANALLNPGDAAPAKYLSPQDYPHHVAISSIYQLPFGQGRRFVSHANKFLQPIIGGWDLSYIYVYQSGAPVNFGDVLLTGNPNNIALPSGQRSPAKWFNTSMFNTNSVQQLADNLVTLSPTFAKVRADAYNSSDESLLKNVRIHEQVRVEFRADFLNIFNQVSFAAPNVTPTSSSFGIVTAQMNVPRRIQAMLKIQF